MDPDVRLATAHGANKEPRPKGPSTAATQYMHKVSAPALGLAYMQGGTGFTRYKGQTESLGPERG